jgi:hypothetical protein
MSFLVTPTDSLRFDGKNMQKVGLESQLHCTLFAHISECFRSVGKKNNKGHVKEFLNVS